MTQFNMVPDIEQLDNYATTYSLGDNNIYSRPITIELRAQIDGPDRWAAVMDKTWCLSKDMEWLYEPMPSNRSDEFISKTRFDTPAGVLHCLKNALAKRSPDKLYIG